MRIFIAGASGAVGRRLVPMLVARGHEVVGTTRTPSKAGELAAAGAQPMVVDALDADALRVALAQADPEVVVDELTALSRMTDFRKFEEGFAQTNRLRTEGTDNLLAGIRGLRVRRIVAQSYAGPGFFARTGDFVKTEDAGFDKTPPAGFRRTVESMRYLEQTLLGAAGLDDLEVTILRYGGLYGPGTSLGLGGGQLEAVRKRMFPVVGSGAGVSSFLHIEDAAAATLLAIEARRTGVFNIVDDEPAAVRNWLPALAEAIGARPPRHFPVWLARLFVGDGVVMMTESRGASNAKAKRELGWEPIYPSWRTGFRDGLGSAGAAEALVGKAAA